MDKLVKPATLTTPAYAALDATDAARALVAIERREPGPHDVLIDILYCGVCHSDIHQARDEWGGSIFPMVPGHEIVGRVAEVGDACHEMEAGDIVGVGCFVDSCRRCEACRAGEEQYCEAGMTLHLQRLRARRQDADLRRLLDAHHRRRELRAAIPSGIPLERAAPLLCAGITTYSPLRHFGLKAGDKRRRRRAWAASATWRSSSATPWARMSPCSATRLASARTRCSSAPTISSSRASEATFKDNCRALRLHHRHRLGAARLQRLSRAAAARRHHGAGRRAGAGAARVFAR